MKAAPLAAAIATAAALSAAVPVGRLRGRKLAAYTAVPAIGAAGLAGAAVQEASVTKRAGIAAAVGGAIATGQLINVVMDRAAMRTLGRFTSHPRYVWMAVNAGIGGAAALISPPGKPRGRHAAA